MFHHRNNSVVECFVVVYAKDKQDDCNNNDCEFLLVATRTVKWNKLYEYILQPFWYIFVKSFIFNLQIAKIVAHDF